MSTPDAQSDLPVIIVGAGGHSRVLAEALMLSSIKILGVVDIDPAAPPPPDLPLLGGDDAVLAMNPSDVRLINGIGGTGNTAPRRAIFRRFTDLGFRFARTIHPSAIISRDVTIGEGVHVLAGVIIQPGVRIGENALINIGALISHDCVIGAHVQIAPGVTLSGHVHVGEATHIGTGAAVIQDISIGEEALVASGAVVVSNVPARTRVCGVPARA